MRPVLRALAVVCASLAIACGDDDGGGRGGGGPGGDAADATDGFALSLAE